jgi:hypothetical protein
MPDSELPIEASVSLNDRPLAIALANVRASERETLSDEIDNPVERLPNRVQILRGEGGTRVAADHRRRRVAMRRHASS